MAEEYIKISKKALEKFSDDLYLSGDHSNTITAFGYASHIKSALQNFIWSIQDDNKET